MAARRRAAGRRGLLSKLVRFLIRWLIYAVAAVAAVLALIVVGFAVQARYLLPDLKAWHRVELAGEFKAGSAAAPQSFAEYRRLEDRLFAELRGKILEDPDSADPFVLGRYNPRSVPAKLA